MNGLTKYPSPARSISILHISVIGHSYQISVIENDQISQNILVRLLNLASVNHFTNKNMLETTFLDFKSVLLVKNFEKYFPRTLNSIVLT